MTATVSPRGPAVRPGGLKNRPAATMDEVLSYHRALAAHITSRLQRIEQKLDRLAEKTNSPTTGGKNHDC